MNKCEILREYSEFVAMVRDHSQRLSVPQAVEQTVVAFIEREGLLTGIFEIAQSGGG